MADKQHSFSLKALLAPFAIDAPAINIRELAMDSREVCIHKLFLAVPGHRSDGRDFIPQAISLGARAILAQVDEASRHGELEMREHTLIVHFYNLNAQLSELAARFYQHPSEQLQTMAVTGTNGKTSTTYLFCQLAKALDCQAGYVGTLGAGFIDALATTQNTTPVAPVMQRICHQLVQKQAQQLAFEASSHALVQGRISSVKTDVAIFTNLSRDHLDYHRDMQDYAQAKRRLMQQPGLQYLLLNQNDAEHKNWLQHCPSGVEAIVFGIDITPVTPRFCVARELRFSHQGVAFELDTSWGSMQVQSPLLGEFNVANLLAAFGAQLCLGADFTALVQAISQLQPVTGRMERFAQQDGPDVVVDYAHTPDALEQVLTTLNQHSDANLWCLFGCGGDRDQGKRPQMGEIAERLANQVVVTTDNSRNEDPQAIINDILSGCQNPEQLMVEVDRKAAIKKALSLASCDDILLLAGKGHEQTQVIGEQVLPYDERQYLSSLISEA